jgi:hypothetical protein
MVRLIVAGLVEVGHGRMSAAQLQQVLQAGDRSRLPVEAAPPHGLYLSKVRERATPSSRHASHWRAACMCGAVALSVSSAIMDTSCCTCVHTRVQVLYELPRGVELPSAPDAAAAVSSTDEAAALESE